MLQVILVAMIGLVTSFLSSIAGGGGGLIVLPSLLAIGVAPLQAIGTVKFGALGILVGSAAKVKGKGVVRKDHLRKLAMLAAAASIVGPQIALRLDNDQVRVISATLISLTALATLYTWRVAGRRREVTVWSRRIGYIIYFILAAALGGFGSGVGLINGYILIIFLGMSSLESLSTRRIIGLVSIPLQLIAFIGSGQVNMLLGLALIVGNAIGGYIGMHVAIKKGSEFVKKAMAVASVILVISLFV